MQPKSAQRFTLVKRADRSNSELENTINNFKHYKTRKLAIADRTATQKHSIEYIPRTTAQNEK